MKPQKTMRFLLSANLSMRELHTIQTEEPAAVRTDSMQGTMYHLAKSMLQNNYTSKPW